MKSGRWGGPVPLLPLVTSCWAPCLGDAESLRTSYTMVDVFMFRVPHERRKEKKKKHKGLPEDQRSPHGHTLQKGEGAQSPEDKTEPGEDKAAEEGPSLSKTDPRKDAKGKAGHLSTAKAVGQSWELSPPMAESFCVRDVSLSRIPFSPYPLQTEKCALPRARLPQQGSFQHFMDMRAAKRLAGQKQRRSRFGNVSVHKCYQFGQVFSPFQALATTEMQRLVFPQDLPMSPHVQRMGASCSTDVNLQDLPLSSTELGLGKDVDNHEKGEPASHMKTPLFPPIVKATKSNDMK
uniref:Uncharacterized protein n=1 Tax=Prolemur simus TaxID=1328070 RepID=A0A8C8YG21_PROSS